MQEKMRLGIIGVTGSIGVQAQDVVLSNPDMFEVAFVTAHTNNNALNEAATKLKCKTALLTKNNLNLLNDVIDENRLDLVLVGASGTEILPYVHKMALKGINLAIANKESIVSSGKLLMSAAKAGGGNIIPVDSEHSAIFQCICGHNSDDVAQIVLTASGGAFRDLSINELENVTVEAALNHPNWSMGRKITIDSATMMNKGLELMEARILFDIAPSKLSAVIHPQSIVHSMVTYKDGSTIAQLGPADMRTPISYALGLSKRINSGVNPLNFAEAGMKLSFRPVDKNKYACYTLALKILNEDKQSLMIAMNAANEIAVEAFLQTKVKYMDIHKIINKTIDKINCSEPNSIEEVLYIDGLARAYTNEILKTNKEFV